MLGLQSDESRTMIDSVVWAQYINVTHTYIDSHVAIANAVPTHLRRAAKTISGVAYRVSLEITNSKRTGYAIVVKWRPR